MNPTSAGTRSPGYTLPPSSSSSSQKEVSEQASSPDQTRWDVVEGCFFPVYSKSENQKFRQTFDQCVKEISLHLQTMMACLSENFPDAITTPWKAFSTLISCLGDEFPQQIPLSIFTSAVATACIANIEASPPAKKSKTSDSLEESTIRNKTLTSAQKLAAAISSTLAFLQTDLQLNRLKEKNPDSLQANRALRHALSQKFSFEHFTVLDNADYELAERIISAIDLQGDMCSHEAKLQLLKSAMSEFVNTQECLICDTYTGLAHQKKNLPLTGKGLLAICIQHSTNSITVSENIEWLPSWQKLIFCYLAKTFLQKTTMVMPPQADVQSLLAALEPYCSTFSQVSKLQCATNSLAEHFVCSFSPRYSRKNPPSFDLSIRYNEFLQCISLVKNLLKGFFILESNICFSSQNLSSFQQYTQALYLPNATEAINNAVQEIASICSEELQKISSYTRTLLETTSTLLRQLIFQSVAIRTIQRKKSIKRTDPKTIIKCEWMPEEIFQSSLFCNSWKEAIWAHYSGVLFQENFSQDSQALTSRLSDTSVQLKTTFQELCYNLLMDVLEEVPLEYNENTLKVFLEKARTLQIKMIPTYAPTALLFSIVIKFIAKPENFVACNLLLDLAKQNFQATQKDFVFYTCKFLFQNENYIPETPEDLFLHLQKQVQGRIQISASLTKFPFWKECIFLSLTCIFLETKQKPIPLPNSVEAAIVILQRYFPKIVIAKKSLPERLISFRQALVRELELTQCAPIRIAAHVPSSMAVYDDTKYKKLFRSIASFNTIIQAFFKLDTGKNLSPKNLCIFQKYMNKFLSNVKNIYSQKIPLSSFAVYLEETQLFDESSEKIKFILAMFSGLLKQLMEGAIAILISQNRTYNRPLQQTVVAEAFCIIHSDACVPEILISSPESSILWKALIKNPIKKTSLSQISSFIEATEKKYSETAVVLTQCFLILCQQVLMHTSKELLLECAISQSLEQQEQKSIEIISFIYPRIILESYSNRSHFKDVVSFLAKDALHTNNGNVLRLAIKHYLTTQKQFVTRTYIYLIQQKLSLPLTTEHFLTFCKQQYRSTTPIPLTMSTLSSWDNHIFCSLAYIFLLKNQAKIAQSFHSWNPETVITHIAPFFPKVTKEIEDLPLATQIKTFQMCLTQYFGTPKSLDIHDMEKQTIEVDPYACRAYENFLRSASLLKDLVRILFTIETGKTSPSQHLQQFRSYIKKLLVNTKAIQGISTLQDLAIICSGEPQFLEQNIPNVLWEDLIHANCLLENCMEVSLALVMLCEPTITELTPSRALDIALQIISSKQSFPTALNAVFTAFINSLSGTNALQKAVNAYISGTLCFQILEKIQTLPKGVEKNSLQTTIDARVSDRVCPQSAEWISVLSSVLLSNKKTLENLCKKLYITLQTDVASAISKESRGGTPSQNFIKTANTCHAKMISENHSTLPLFQSLVLVLAQKTEDALQKNQQGSFEPSITTAEISTIEEDLEELPTNIWQEIRDALLTETNEAALMQESKITTTPATETDQSPDELWQGIEELLSAEDFTDLLGQGASVLGTENIEFESEEDTS